MGGRAGGGRGGRHLAEEPKFTERKVTEVHYKPTTPYPARLGTDHQLSQSAGAGAGRTLQKAEQRQRMAAGGRCKGGLGPSPEAGYVWEVYEGAPPEGTAKQGTETSTGKSAHGEAQRVRAKDTEVVAQKPGCF